MDRTRYQTGSLAPLLRWLAERAQHFMTPPQQLAQAQAQAQADGRLPPGRAQLPVLCMKVKSGKRTADFGWIHGFFPGVTPLQKGFFNYFVLSGLYCGWSSAEVQAGEAPVADAANPAPEEPAGTFIMFCIRAIVQLSGVLRRYLLSSTWGAGLIRDLFLSVDFEMYVRSTKGCIPVKLFFLYVIEPLLNFSVFTILFQLIQLKPLQKHLLKEQILCHHTQMLNYHKIHFGPL